MQVSLERGQALAQSGLSCDASSPGHQLTTCVVTQTQLQTLIHSARTAAEPLSLRQEASGDEV